LKEERKCKIKEGKKEIRQSERKREEAITFDG
jgi:hypothetical protein